MKTAVSDTSIATYHALRRDGTLSERKAQIMAVIAAGRDYTLQELVRLTGLPVNVISGRVNELKASGSLVHGTTRACSVTGRTVHPVRRPTGSLN